MFKTEPSVETRVVSLNTDSIAIQIQEGDEDRISQVISDWEEVSGFQMERSEVIAHRGLNINSYIEVVREGDDPPYLKSKGSLAHDPGITADHNQLVVARAIGQWMMDGTPIDRFIRDAAARREILIFTEMRSAPSSALRYGGESIGRLARVYRSTRKDLPKLTKDATGAASEQQLESGFAYLPGIDWPVEDDVDVDWYIQQAMLIFAQTSTNYSPHHNKLANQLSGLGLEISGVGGAATVISNGVINEEALAKGTDKNPHNFSGDRGLAVSVSKSSGVVGVAAGVLDSSSLVLSYGYVGQVVGEIHSRALIDKSKLKELRSKGIDFLEKGFAKVYDSRDGLIPLNGGLSVGASNEVIPSMQGPESNDEFLEVMFGESITDAFVCSNTTPPDSENGLARAGMWMGGPLHFSNNRYKDATRQNYTCVSGFKTDSEGVYYRQNEFFDALYFIVLDDIGTKVSIDPRTLGFGEPTFINETSPGNHQWYYKLSEPVRDLSIASYLTKQVLATPVQGYLMTDQGAKGITRLCKLPHGMNLKLSLGKPWQNRSVSWRPDLSYSAQTIAGWFGMQIDNVPHINAAPSASATQASDHPLIHALHSAQLLMSAQQKGSGWWDIVCHQRHLHSPGAGVDSGTAIKIREDGSWTYRCQHGHCAELKPRDLYRYLSERGFDLTPPQHKIYIKRVDRGSLKFDASIVVGEDFSFLDPDDGGANDEVDYPDPEHGGGSGGSIGSASLPSGGAGKPTIYIDPGHLPSIVKSCSKILDDVIFKRGIYLVRIGRGSELEDGLSRIGNQPVVLPVTRSWLVRELTERAVFLRWNEKINDYKVIDCPVNIATTLETGTDDYTFRPLTALANAPFLRVDGSICDAPGYDCDTGIYYAPNLVFPSISSSPSWQEARDALDLIGNLVKQFPFANAVSKSVFLSDVLTAIARPTLPKSPVVLYNATMAGSGKTLMASVANLIAYGHATTHPWPGVNEEELKKVFTSVLLAGDPIVVFDNLPNGAMIKSAALSQFATSDDYADRKLGFSERVKFRNRTRVVLTGNNITLASDNARRTLVCDLQLEVESIKDRVIDFEYPSLAQHIKQNRPLYIAAALTVLKAYAVHGDPLLLSPLDSFEDWSWRVREALVWLGEEDPVAAVTYENDGSGEIANVFATIQSIANLKQSASKEKDFRSNDLANWAAGNFSLRDALEQAGCTDTTSSAKLGYWLRAHKNRIAGGLKLISKQIHGGRQPGRWSLISSINGKSSDF
jgi:putative DNA primase/helicase